MIFQGQKLHYRGTVAVQKIYEGGLINTHPRDPVSRLFFAIVVILRSSNCGSCEFRFTFPSVEFELKDSEESSKRGEEKFRRAIVAKDTLLESECALLSMCPQFEVDLFKFVMKQRDKRAPRYHLLTSRTKATPEGKRERKREREQTARLSVPRARLTTKDAARQFL